MISSDPKARIEQRWFFEPQSGVPYAPARSGYGIALVVGKKPVSRIFIGELDRYRQEMERIPVLISNNQPPGPHWWWYRNVFYKTNESLSSGDVKALIEAEELKKNRKIAHAKAVLAADSISHDGSHLFSISDRHIKPAVKEAVWKRDGGRCARCGSQRKLEFDHIIPVSMGGSSTARNIQLLCETCNRSKGGCIV